MGCSQNSLTSRNPPHFGEYPQVKRGSTHSRSEALWTALRNLHHRAGVAPYRFRVPERSVRAVQDADVDERDRVEAAYRMHADRMWRALHGFTGDRDIASDALAEAFARALRDEHRIRDLPAWLWRVSFRIAVAEMRQRTRALPVEHGSIAHEIPEAVPDVRWLGERVLSACTNSALVLHDYADRPTSEVAATLGCSRATVHVHLSKGRRKLRTLLEEQQDA